MNDEQTHGSESKNAPDHEQKLDSVSKQNEAEEQSLGQETESEQTSAAESGSEVEELRQALTLEQEKITQANDRCLRIRAEMENLEKRTEREIENVRKYALEKFINELLPVIDSMELGLSASKGADNVKSLQEGMQLTLKKLSDVMEKFNTRVISPEGDKFDPNLHEAVLEQETEDYPSGQVVEVIQRGYELNGRLVRPARVIVAK